jgi:GcrA cell cycle regulator
MAAQFEWTPERVAELRESYEGGMSVGVLARKFGASRGSVTGKLSRLGIKRSHAPAQSLLPPKPSPAPVLIEEINGNDIARVKLADLEFWSCAYPCGDPRSADFGYCGQPRKPSSPYCAAHHARCYLPPQPRKV